MKKQNTNDMNNYLQKISQWHKIYQGWEKNLTFRKTRHIETQLDITKMNPTQTHNNQDPRNSAQEQNSKNC